MKLSVFTKIFAYTMLLLILMSVAAALLFAREFLAFYQAEQQRRLSASFQPILNAMGDRDKSTEELLDAAKVFANNNQSFRFLIQEGDGNILFSTPGAPDLTEDDPAIGVRIRVVGMVRSKGEAQENMFIFTGYSSDSGFIDYGDLVKRSLLALVVMLIIAISGAILFAKKVTKPLEDEIIRERVMEENQRLFFSAASHELKTPIAAARALVEGMIAGVGDFRDHRKYLRECIKTLDSQARLVSEILEIVKLSNAEVEPSLAPLDLSELGSPVLAEYRPLAEQRRLFIQGDFPSLLIQADRNLLQRVLSNVIANAVQNTPSGGTIRIEIDTEEHPQKKQQCFRLRILNTNARIPEDVISRLFEPFYRLDLARTHQDSQSGLGLTIVKKALDRMKFVYALENTPEGVLFWVDLPVKR
jgi:two-component system sensor histidine kinase VanS